MNTELLTNEQPVEAVPTEYVIPNRLLLVDLDVWLATFGAEGALVLVPCLLWSFSKFSVVMAGAEAALKCSL